MNRIPAQIQAQWAARLKERVRSPDQVHDHAHVEKRRKAENSSREKRTGVHVKGRNLN
jgi:hypothetical protein